MKLNHYRYPIGIIQIAPGMFRFSSFPKIHKHSLFSMTENRSLFTGLTILH